ncbi:MAG: AI-2E family transporter [Acidobacteria bacterium]|nr:MAG: AI-2E family transporter [Acidobacteriota bacterium]
MTDASRDSTYIQRALKWTIFLGATALIVYACLLILKPFLDVIAWSAVLAIAFYPVHQRLVRKTGRVALSAFVCSVLVVGALLIPLMFITGLAINQLMHLRDYLQETFKEGFSLGATEPLRSTFEWTSRRLGFDFTQFGDWIAQHANELGRVIAEHSLTIAANVTSLVVSILFTIFAMFLLFRDGERLVALIPDLLPFDRARSEAMLLHIREVIYGSVYGVVVVALMQGGLCGVMFWILGIPSAALWGMTTVLTSVLPLVGAAVVWVPGTVYLLAVGRWPQAIVLAVWGTFVISGVDNFLRPKLIGDRIGLSELVMFFAILGGLQVFGVLGIVLGPVLFAIATSILELLSERDTGGPIA